MKYHAHKIEETNTWNVYTGDSLVLSLPGWVPFSVVNEMVRGLTRTDANGFVTEVRTGTNPVWNEVSA